MLISSKVKASPTYVPPIPKTKDRRCTRKNSTSEQRALATKLHKRNRWNKSVIPRSLPSGRICYVTKG